MRIHGLLTLLLLAVACGGGGGSPTAQAQSFSIPAAGGTFDSGDGIRITFPEGAVDADTTFRYEPIPRDQWADLPSHLGVVRGFRLSIEPAETTAIAQTEGEEGSGFQLHPYRVRFEGSLDIAAGERTPIRWSVVHETSGDGESTFLPARSSWTTIDRARGLVSWTSVQDALGSIYLLGGDGEPSVAEAGVDPAEEGDYGARMRVKLARAFEGTVGIQHDGVELDGPVTWNSVRAEGDVIGTASAENPEVDWGLPLADSGEGDYSAKAKHRVLVAGSGVELHLPESIKLKLKWSGMTESRPVTGERDGERVFPLVEDHPETPCKLMLAMFGKERSRQSIATAVETGYTELDLATQDGAAEFVEVGGLGVFNFGVVVLRKLAESAGPQPAQAGGEIDYETLVVFGSGGAFVRTYIPGQGFSPLTGTTPGFFTDGLAFGGDPLTDGCILTNNNNNELHLIGGPLGIVRPSGFPTGTGKVFSAYMPSANGPVVAVTSGSPGAAWIISDLFTGAVTKLADTEGDPRRIRVQDDIVAVSNFESDSLSIYRWNGDDTFTLLKHEPVGDGPVGIDLKTLDDGRVAIVSTGYNSNDYVITVVDPATGSVTSGPCTALPAECTGPGHAIWIADSNEQRVVISCNTSHNLVTRPVQIP